MMVDMGYILSRMDAISEEFNELKGMLKLCTFDGKTKFISVGRVHQMAVLDKIYSMGGSVDLNDLLNVVKRYGKNPGSVSGYFSGKRASLAKGEGSKRMLTEFGKNRVVEFRSKYGEND
jgi:hypothetical protein